MCTPIILEARRTCTFCSCRRSPRNLWTMMGWAQHSFSPGGALRASPCITDAWTRSGMTCVQSLWACQRWLYAS